MHSLLVTLRAAQLVAHAYHHRISGPTFHEDHEFFAEAYRAYEIAYDDVAERMLGLGAQVKFDQVAREAVAGSATLMLTAGNVGMYKTLLNFEESIQNACVQHTPDATLGTQNLLAQIADDSEKRVYKMKQRVGA